MRFPKHLSGAHAEQVIDEQSRQIAFSALSNVGDAALGEWVQGGHAGPLGARIWHVRRRLSDRERRLHKLDVIDLRNTTTGNERLRKLLTQRPHLRTHAMAAGEWPW